MVRTLCHRLLLGTTLACLVGCADVLGVETLSGVSTDAGVDVANTLDAGGDSLLPVSDAAPATETGGCQITWVDASGGAVPAGAVENSDVGNAVVVYVCRVDAPALGVIPGKLLPGWACYYGDGQVEQQSQDYQVLVPQDCTIAWGAAVTGVAPVNALVCGEDLEGGVLYSCRAGSTAEYPGELGHVGWSTDHDCLYSYGGASLTTTDYTILTAQ